MNSNIKISNLESIYNNGLKVFTEDFLKEKAEKKQNVVYSINGQIVKLSADDVCWLYMKLKNGLEDWEVNLLNEVSERGDNMVYNFDDQKIEIPASVVLDLFDRLSDV